jgi:diguanylate cyclase (GGDEF)-like protein
VPLAEVAFLGAGAWALLQALHALAWRRGNLDELTGLPSRRALDERLPKLAGRYAVAVLDLDRFKSVNDRHGHEAGDAVLQAVARQLQRFEGGTFFRSGGEEFVAILPGLDLDQAHERLEELRERIAAEPVRVSGLPGRRERRLRVTASIGAAQRTTRDPSPERVIAAADAALLRAKQAGRNRVEVERRALKERARRRVGRTGRRR